MSDVPPPPPPPPPPVPPAGIIGAPLTGALGPVGKRRSAGLVIVLSIVTCGVWQFVWSFQNGDELKRHNNDGLGGALYLLFTILLYPVTMFLMAGEVENMYRREGKEPPITAIWGLWFLLPIIGNFIWYLRIQGALNDYWTEHGATNDPSL
jgi:Domain of unknown function (DUF4234)